MPHFTTAVIVALISAITAQGGASAALYEECREFVLKPCAPVFVRGDGKAVIHAPAPTRIPGRGLVFPPMSCCVYLEKSVIMGDSEYVPYCEAPSYNIFARKEPACCMNCLKHRINRRTGKITRCKDSCSYEVATLNARSKNPAGGPHRMLEDTAGKIVCCKHASDVSYEVLPDGTLRALPTPTPLPPHIIDDRGAIKFFRTDAQGKIVNDAAGNPIFIPDEEVIADAYGNIKFKGTD